MKTKATLLTLLLLSFSLVIVAQKINIKIDLTKLDMGNIDPNTVYVSLNYLETVSDVKELSFKVNQLPNLLEIGIIKKHKLQIQRMIWVEEKNISIEGSIENKESLNFLPTNKLQEIADKMLPAIVAGKNPDDTMVFTKPYLVYLNKIKKNKKKNILKKL